MLRRPLAVHALTSTAFDGALKTKDMTATVTAADLAAAEVELTSDEQDLVQVLVAAAAVCPTSCSRRGPRSAYKFCIVRLRRCSAKVQRQVSRALNLPHARHDY